MWQVQLNPGLRGGKWAYLRSLCGHDEAFIEGADAVEAVAFLDRLLVEAPGTTVGPGKASDLAICDGDRLFASIYRRYFGERIAGTAACRACREPFELSFSLPDVLVHPQQSAMAQTTGPDDEGLYTLSDGRRFRLPTASDQHSIIGFGAEQAATTLLARCVVDGDPLADPEYLQAAMDEVGALLDLDLDAACPGCGVSQIVRFDMQGYVLHALRYEQRFLLHEVHRIAMAYGWSHAEILNLRREDRRAFARLTETNQAARRRVRI